MSIDPKLLAEWQAPDRTRVLFQPDSSVYSGAVGVPYKLEDSGSILNIDNRSYYTRLSDLSMTSIAGHWRDDPNGEEITFRADGRYIAISDDDPLVYFGVYTTTPTSLSSYEYRGICTTDGDRITFNSIFSSTQTGQYTVTENTLVIQMADFIITYSKVANPALNLTIQQPSQRHRSRIF